MSEDTFVEPGSLLLIFEEIGEQAKPLGLGIPSLKITDTLKLDASHKKLQRRVYQAVFKAEVYAGESKLDRSPNLLDWFAQYIQPDKSLTMRSTEKVLGYVLSYFGYKNKFSLQKNLSFPLSVDLPFIDVYGSDPAPGAVLYGNNAITFSSLGGTEALTGAAFYDLKTKKLRNVDTSSKKELFTSLVKNSGRTKQ